MKVMKKLLIGAVCVLTFAVSACAVNGDGDNDQNDDLNVEESLEYRLHHALHSWYGETKYESDGNLNDTIIPLIRQGADITDENIISDPQLLHRVVFNNSCYNELPDTIKNRILGESLLYYVKHRTLGLNFDANSVDLNYRFIKKLLKDFNAPTNFLDNEGRTVLEIAENRNTLWKEGTYNIADDPEFLFMNEIPWMNPAAMNPRLLANLLAKLKKHDQKVYKLFTRYISRNQDNNCCTIC